MANRLRWGSPEAVLEGLRDAGERLGRAPRTVDGRTHDFCPSDSAVRNYFGSWNAALTLVGLETRTQGGLQPSLRAEMERTRVADVERFAREVKKTDARTLGEIGFDFGWSYQRTSDVAHLVGWDTTFIRSRSAARGAVRKFSDEDLLTDLRAFSKFTDSEFMSSYGYRHWPPAIASIGTFKLRFGSWSEAVRCAGLRPLEGVRRGCPPIEKSVVVDAVTRFWQEGGRTYTAYDRWYRDNDAPCTSIVQMRLGSWSAVWRLMDDAV